MSMFLSAVALFAVKPSVKRGFYEMASVPQICPEMEEWLDGEKYDFDAKRVKNAKLIGIHDHAAVMETDIRFNGREWCDPDDEPHFIVVKRKDGTYVAALGINGPEAAILLPVLNMLTGETGWGEPWVALSDFTKKKAKRATTAEVISLKAVAAEIPAAPKAPAPKRTAVKKPAAKKPATKKVAADKEAAKFDPKLGVFNVMNKLRARR
jgi:hypothetical protein